MKKLKWFKRVISGALAVAVCATSLFSGVDFGDIVAYAATYDTTPSGKYWIVFEGSNENGAYIGKAGDGNGIVYHHSLAKNHSTSGAGAYNWYTNTSIGAFCVNLNSRVNNGNVYAEITPMRANTRQKQKLIAEICTAGGHPDHYNNDSANKFSYDKNAYIAMQCLIWETIDGKTPANYGSKRPTGTAGTIYDRIRLAMRTRRNSTSVISTPTYTFKYVNNKWTVNVPISDVRATIANGAGTSITEGIDFALPSGWSFTVSGSNYVFTSNASATNPPSGTISCTKYIGSKLEPEYHEYQYLGQQHNNFQQIAWGKGYDPIKVSLKFVAEPVKTGGFTFRKQWKNIDSTDKTLIKSVVADAEFVLRKGTTYYNFKKIAEGNYVHDGTTTTNIANATKMKTVLTSGGGEGIIWMDGLLAGQYTVDEIPKYNKIHSCRSSEGDSIYHTYFRAGSVDVNIVAGKKPVQDQMTSPMMNWYSFQHADLEVYKQDDKYKGIQGAKFGLYVDYTELRKNNGNGAPQKYDYVIETDGNIFTRNGVQWKVGTQVQTATSDINGKVDFGAVPAYAYIGENVYRFRYIVKELEAPKGYALSADGIDGHSIKMDAKAHSVQGQYTGETIFTNAPQRMEITINKVDDKGKKLQGAVFGLYSNQDGLELRDITKTLHTIGDVKVYHKGDLIAYGTTNSNGELVFGDEKGQVLCRKLNEQTGVMRNLLEGKYYVQEITPPKNYIANKQKYEFTFTPNNKTEKKVFEYEATVPNKPKNGEITVIKEGHNKVKLAGAEFKLYPTDATVTVNGKKYAAGQTIADGETDSNGKLVFPRVPTGYKYTIEETKAPKGYALSSNSKKTFDLDDNDNVASYIKLSRTFTNDAYGEVTVVKNDMNGVALAGAKFAIYTSENDAKNGTNAVATGSTKKNSDGTVSPVTFTKLLPDTHTYWLVELTPPPGFLAKGTVTINDGTAKTITQAKQPIKLIFKNVDGTPTTYAKYSKAVFKNTEQEARITVNKVGTDGVTSIPLANAEFKITAAEDIYSQNGKLIYTKGTQIKSGIKTDSNGKLVISSDQTDGVGTAKAKLYCGTYTVTETKAPNGYRLPSNPSQDVTITKDDTPTAQFKNRSITFKNSTGVVIRAYKVDKQTGKLIAGAQYGLYAAQDVKSLDGKTVLWKKNAQIATSTITNTKGMAKFYRNGSTKEIAILFGYKYFVKEIKPPKNYILDKNWRWDIDLTSYSSTSTNLPVIIENNGKNGNADPNFNDWQTGNVIVKKVYNDGTKKPLAGAQFTLYAGEDVLNSAGKIYTLEITNADGTTKSIKLKKDTKIAVSNITGADGLAKFKDDKGNEIKVPVGFTFYVKETKTPAGFKADPNTKTEFTLDYDVSVDYVKMDAKPLEKDNKPIEVYISKEKLTGKKPLVGAKLAVINTATNETFAEWQSTGTEKLLSQIPAGNYILRETITPDGCVVTTDIKFKVTTDGKVINVSCLNGNLYEIRVKNDTPLIVMFDEFTKVKISKVEIGTNKELKGATLEIKDKATGKIVKDANGKELKWVSNGEAKVIEGVFIVGRTYILTETAAPEGHIIAKSVEFTIKDRDRTTGKYVVQPVVMKDDYTRVEISKTDITTGKEVKGAKLYIIDSKGNKIAEWITNGTPYKLYRLAKGHYTLYEEFAPTAQGYVRTKKVEFDVDDKSSVVQKVKMEDNYTKLAILKTDKETSKPLAGAVLQLLKTDGTVYKEWTTTDKEYRIDYIPIGTYTLHEKTAPAGYVKFKDQTIVINEQDFIDEQSKDPNYIKRVIAKDDIITVEIDKTSITDGKKVIGAHLVIKNSKGKIFAEWNTTEKPHTIKRMPAGEYTLTETYAPNGYVIANTVKFTVKETGEIQKVHMIDDITKLEISKYKANAKTDDDKPLAGAVLKLTDKETGKIVDQWTTNGTPHKIYEKLTAGKTYVLEEISAPAGYVVCKDKKEITISVDGKIDRLSLTDDTTKVELSKKKITGDDELKGAKLQIIDTTTNKVVEEWTSTNKPHYLEAKLIAGRKYILREIAAPDEYALTSDVTFTVSTDGSIDKVDIRDTNLAELPTAGGVGTGIFCIFGIFMMLAAVMLKKRED